MPVLTSADPVVVPADEVLAGLTVARFEATEPGVDELGVDALPLADVDADAVVLGLAVVLVGVEVGLEHEGVPVALAVAFAFVPVALVLAVAEALPVAVPLALTVAAVLVAVLAVVVVLPGLALPVAALPLVLVLAGLVTGTSGVGVGLDDLPLFVEGDGEALGVHAVAGVRPAEVPAGLGPLAGALARVPVPAGFPTPLPLPLAEEEVVIPTAEPIWSMASRVGGNARTTPTANTAQAIARTGRSRLSRQSPGWRRA
ncbi:MAG: hypothetical protein ACRDNT_17520 [Streptosporangiaceae bacterium]